MSSKLQIAIFGGAECDAQVGDLAYATGEALAHAGAVLVCGGRGGVMAAACQGAHDAGGVTLGVLPGIDAQDSTPNPALSHVVYTGMGQARNLAVVLSSAAAIAIGGGWGTLSEIALALKHQIPVVTLASWTLDRPDGRAEPLLEHAATAGQAVELALDMARRERLG
ncbi:MAG: TIGR00725 family protein [Acidobacteriota bacterium]